MTMDQNFFNKKRVQTSVRGYVFSSIVNFITIHFIFHPTLTPIISSLIEVPKGTKLLLNSGGGGGLVPSAMSCGFRNPRHTSGHLQLTITVYLLFWLNKLSFYVVIQFYNLLEILSHEQTLF